MKSYSSSPLKGPQHRFLASHLKWQQAKWGESLWHESSGTFTPQDAKFSGDREDLKAA